MTPADLDHLERLALAQLGKPISTTVAVLPGELLELIQRARRAPVPAEPDPQ